jgi:hypothetical protein
VRRSPLSLRSLSSLRGGAAVRRGIHSVCDAQGSDQAGNSLLTASRCRSQIKPCGVDARAFRAGTDPCPPVSHRSERRQRIRRTW